jgi:hypothetical protein
MLRSMVQPEDRALGLTAVVATLSVFGFLFGLSDGAVPNNVAPTPFGSPRIAFRPRQIPRRPWPRRWLRRIPVIGCLCGTTVRHHCPPPGPASQ